ncbi:MAG: mechanosensitive ion channel family protein [Gammaproteobacteria bacterium]
MLDWLSFAVVVSVARAVLLVVVGLGVARVVSQLLVRVLKEKIQAHTLLLAQKAVYYGLLVLFGVGALRELGFNLTVLLGAAGVASVAIGFASQTSASNLISGLFLLFEEPFEVGDIIKIGDTLGEVISVDLLSVKLRTFDNLFVRIPNETLIKSEVTTLTKFPIRRVDLRVGVAYKEDIARVREVLQAVAERNPFCLDEPEPLFIFLGFGDSSIDLQFSVWAKRENFLDVKNTVQEEIKIAFDQQGIEIPFPHRTLYAGSVTEPIPVQLSMSPASSTSSVVERGASD